MAPRGGFRGRGRGGSFRGRGGRGGSRGRGRGRGGAAYASQGPRFESSRLADKEEDSSEESGSEGPEVENELHTSEEDEVSEDEEDNKVTAQPYMSLIKSLTENASEPSAKRRKLDNGAASNDEPKETEESDSDEAEVKDTDLVEEPEEAPDETRIEDLFEGDEDETPDSSDPFETHFASPDEDSFPNKVKAVQQGAWLSKKIATKTARNVLMLPNTNNQDLATLPAPIIGPAELKLKHRLQETMEKKRAKFDETEQSMASLMFGYRDVLYCKRDVANGNNLRRLACLHAVNHVFKTRDRVIKNNARLSHSQGNEDLELRDQGFTRPKVLMLLPTRESCYRMIEMICSICEPDQQENRKRFDDSYHDKDQRFGTDKPADFRDLFEGNDDDMFRIGVKFTRKTIKYFAQFYNSDILLASPLGLKMAIGSEEGKKVEHDFLSSIEVVIVDQANALLMQNWEHVESIFEHLNLQPKDAHGCDFSRVRNWYLEDQAKYFRQTLLFSEFNTPELSELFRLHCLNWAGKVRVQSEYSGMIQQLGVRAKQTFSRFESPSIDGDPDARFAYFTKAIIPSLVKRSKDSTGTLIFIPSYLDFVRVRNYFASSPAVASLTFGAVSEYSSTPEASRARAHFFAGRHKVLLYTERAHHFRRYQLKGVQRVIMYGLPDNPIFYKEITGEYLSKAEHDLKLAPGQGTVRAMFSKYDILKLERVVGSQRVGKMIHERGDTFDFV